jgi:hypothetical protein
MLSSAMRIFGVALASCKAIPPRGTIGYRDPRGQAGALDQRDQRKLASAAVTRSARFATISPGA